MYPSPGISGIDTPPSVVRGCGLSCCWMERIFFCFATAYRDICMRWINVTGLMMMMILFFMWCNSKTATFKNIVVWGLFMRNFMDNIFVYKCRNCWRHHFLEKFEKCKTTTENCGVTSKFNLSKTRRDIDFVLV